MIYTIIVISVLIIIIGLISTRDNIFSPAVITAAVWLFCLLLYLFLPHGLPPLTNKFLVALLIWLVLLSLSSLWIQPIVIKQKTTNIQASKLVRDIYLAIGVIALISFIFWVKTMLGAEGFGESWAKKLRSAVVKGDDAFGGLIVIIWHISLILELIYFEKKRWYRVVIVLICCLIFGFFVMSKTTLFNVVVITFSILFFKKIITTKHIVIGLTVLFFAFVAFQELRENKEIKSKESFTTLYLLSGMTAFETIEASSSKNFGENTFRVYYAATYKLGLSDKEPVSIILKFIKKPIVTNIYTVMYPFYKDFGLWGIGIFALICGLFFGWLFANARKGSIFFLAFYAYFVSMIIVQYSGEWLFTNISGNLKFVILLAVPFLVEKYKMFYFEKDKVNMSTDYTD